MSSNQKFVYISGSPRKNSNTDILLSITMSITGGKFVKLSEFNINPCNSCWGCQKLDKCSIEDDFSKTILPLLLKSDGIVVGSPVYFNNVSSHTKMFIDRTWCIRKKLINKIGGAIVVGRSQGAEGAITAINSFFAKHEMLIANRGVSGTAFERQEILQDTSAVDAARALGERIIELCNLMSRK